MRYICTIDLLSQLLAKNLPEKSRKAGFPIHYLELYNGALLSIGTRKRLRAHQREKNLVEVRFSKQEMLRYHQGYAHCGQYCCLAIQDYVAVEYARDEGFVLLTGSGVLQRYAFDRGVEAIGLEDFEERCKQRQRLVEGRKEKLMSHYASPESKDLPDVEPVQQIIDDGITI